MSLLDGKAAVVTGIGPGIGSAVARMLAEHGADVCLGARTEETLKELANEIAATGRRAVYSPTNIADADQCRLLAQTAVDAFGKIDILVQNAFMHGPLAPIETTDPDDWRKVYKVNVMGTLQLVQTCLPFMGDGASIIITSSMAARTGDPEPPGSSAYAASKTAQLSLSRSLTQELGPRGIRVNTVLPGWVHGPSLDVYLDWKSSETGKTPEQVLESVSSETALRRIVSPEDVAGAIVFLASDLAHGITGQQIDVNAGHWLP